MAEENKPIEIKQPHVLVVEGEDDVRFFEELAKHLGLRDIQILSAGGKTKLPLFLRVLPLTPDFSLVDYLSVIRDADTNPDGAFESVCGALDKAGLPVPKQLLVQTDTKPSVAVMILPGDNRQGMLEDLCLEAIAQDPAMLCVTQYFECLEKQKIARPDDMAKAKVHVFLASRKKPDKRLGEAAQANYWPMDSNTFDQVKAFLQRIGS